MSKNKPTLPQGTRDFDPSTVRKRRYIFDTLREVFELYGYQPLETPAMENLDTLMGKYGEEGDKLIFKILNNGLGDPKNIEKSKTAFERVLEGKNDTDLTERALRYDLTIPFARFVAMNHNTLTFPFRRYQMQPVWRADRPQKGRYREFYQCDADVVGSYSLINEVELASIYYTAFKKLGINVEIRINNRKILAALAEVCGGADKLTGITVAIDKLDKIGLAGVTQELAQRGLSDIQVTTIEKYLGLAGSNEEKLDALKALIATSATGATGIAELETILNYPGSPVMTVDLTLARGLNYYTGAIFEIKALDYQIGSIGGGGRYDDLTGTFGVPGIPGVGISFGVDRIYDVMEGLNLFPADVHTGARILFFNLGEAEAKAAFGLLQQLRAKGIAAELYHETAKFDKQFKYAEKKGIPYIVILGSEELATSTVKRKDLTTGRQETLTFEQLLTSLL
ncbi:histidine--tRNA ligase [Puia dinghuensis]|uniref:Histidine--tRNA ligase n=1 Tax=Puia dinghuensis TaxID=1792502 RepID=A0A8J2UHU8_9BACT|nr:histidine--tRNA ligase [Puia dinghuensis]GGB19130.1 histidine--tRNA ligase [Puia dinghuensis]